MLSIGSIFNQAVGGYLPIRAQSAISANTGVACRPGRPKLLTPQQQIRPLLLQQQPQALACQRVVRQPRQVARHGLQGARSVDDGAAAGSCERDQVLAADPVSQALGLGEAQIQRRHRTSSASQGARSTLQALQRQRSRQRPSHMPASTNLARIMCVVPLAGVHAPSACSCTNRLVVPLATGSSRPQ